SNERCYIKYVGFVRVRYRFHRYVAARSVIHKSLFEYCSVDERARNEPLHHALPVQSLSNMPEYVSSSCSLLFGFAQTDALQLNNVPVLQPTALTSRDFLSHAYRACSSFPRSKRLLLRVGLKMY